MRKFSPGIRGFSVPQRTSPCFERPYTCSILPDNLLWRGIDRVSPRNIPATPTPQLGRPLGDPVAVDELVQVLARARLRSPRRP